MSILFSKPKQNPAITNFFLNNIDMSKTMQYRESLKDNLDINNELLTDDEQLEYLNNRNKEFTSYDFKKLKEEVKDLSKDGGETLFKESFGLVTKKVQENLETIIIEASKGETEALKKLSLESVNGIQGNILILLKDKMSEIENKINGNIFPLLNDLLNVLEQNDLNLLIKSLEIKKQIKELQKEENKENEISLKKQEYIDLFSLEDKEKSLEDNYKIRESKYKEKFYENSKSINTIKSGKELFGVFLNTNTLKKIGSGQGQDIIYDFVYKVSVDVLIKNILKMNTDTNYFLKNISKGKQKYEPRLIKKLSEIKLTGDNNKDYASAIVLNEISTTIEIKDMKIGREVSSELKGLTKGIIKDLDKISNFSLEEVEGKIQNTIKTSEETLVEFIDGYKEIIQKINENIEKNITKLLTLDEVSYNILRDLEDIEELNEGNVNKLKAVIKNQEKIYNQRAEKILSLKNISKDINQNIELLKNKESNLQGEELLLIKSEKNKNQYLLDKINNQIEQEESFQKIFKDTFNSQDIDRVESILLTKSEYEKKIQNIKKEYKNLTNIEEEKNLIKDITTKIKNDYEILKNIKGNAKTTAINYIKDLIHYEDFKSLGNNIINIYDKSKKIKIHKNSMIYLKNISEVIKTYGYKDDINLYFKEMSEIATKKLETFKEMEVLTKKLDFIEKASGKYSKEVLKENSMEKISIEIKNIMYELETKKLELLQILNNKNNKSSNENMFDIDKDFEGFLFDNKSVKEIRMMKVIDVGTYNKEPRASNKYYLEALKLEKETKLKLIKKTDVKILKKMGLKFNLENGFSVSYTKNYYDEFKSKISNFLNADENFDVREIHQTKTNVLSYSSIRKYFTNKTEKSFKELNNGKLSLNEFIKETYENFDDEFAFDKNQNNMAFLDLISERNRMSINYLNKMERFIVGNINTHFSIEEKEKTKNVSYKDLMQERENILFFEEYFVELFKIYNEEDINLLREEIKDLSKVKTTSETELKQILNKKAEEIIKSNKFVIDKNYFKLNSPKDEIGDDLIKKTINLKNDEIILSKIENFILNKNIKEKDNMSLLINQYNKGNPVQDILNDIKNLKNFSEINEELVSKINSYKKLLVENRFDLNLSFGSYLDGMINQNDLLKNLQQEEVLKLKTKLISSFEKKEILNLDTLHSNIEKDVNKNYINQNQVHLNNGSNIITKIIDNNENYLNSNNSYTSKKILEYNDLLSSKIKELQTKYYLGKDFYNKTEKDNLVYNIKVLNTIHNKIKSEFIHIFESKQTNFDLIKDFKFKETKTDMILDILYYSNKEEMYNVKEDTTLNIKQYVIELQQKLKDNELNGDKTKINAIIKCFIQTKDDYFKINLSQEEKYILLFLFNELIDVDRKNNEITKTISHLQNHQKTYKNIDDESIIKEKIKKELKSLMNKQNRVIIDSLLKSLNVSLKNYEDKIDKIYILKDVMSVSLSDEEEILLKKTKNNKNKEIKLDLS